MRDQIDQQSEELTKLRSDVKTLEGFYSRFTAIEEKLRARDPDTQERVERGIWGKSAKEANVASVEEITGAAEHIQSNLRHYPPCKEKAQIQ